MEVVIVMGDGNRVDDRIKYKGNLFLKRVPKGR